MSTKEDPIYLDYNATTPVAPEVVEAIADTLKNAWGNPSSKYDAGKKAKMVVETARKNVAEMIGAKESDIIFTSGGTEGNNLVIHSAIQYYHDNNAVNSQNTTKRRKFLPHIITSNIEHDSIALPLKHLSEKGIVEVTFVPVSKQTAAIEVEEVMKEIQPNTSLISVMLANNETGIIQPISLLGKKIRQLNYQRSQLSSSLPPILFHTDAAQALGKIPVNVDDLHVDFLTVVGHKFYGPRVGALYFNSDKDKILYPMYFGGGQERSYRPGTENVAMIAGLGKAAELIVRNLDIYQKNMTKSRDYLENKLKEAFGKLVSFNNCGKAERLPNTCSVAFTNNKIKGQDILEKTCTIQASVGAACHSNNSKQSVLIASGIPIELAESTLRLTTGRDTRDEDIDRAVSDLRKTVQNIYNL
ncbi:selenocysteine lyase-like [Centruroides vittatus]|uniref:selenocysteine lyase-like n=1 Tax=Centruroides vittatus TaxID=120091 RepID=UPI00350ED11A